jgi:hypothetical protein
MKQQDITNRTYIAPEGGCLEGTTPCSLPSSSVIAEQMEYFIPRSKFAKKSAKTYQQIAEQYLTTTLSQIITGIKQAKEDQLNKNQIPIYMDKLRDQNPQQYTYGGKKCWWFDWLLKMYPLFKIVKQGYKHGSQQGTLTMVEIFKIKDSIVEFETAEQTFKRLYSDYADIINDDSQIDWVAIDTQSLRAYITENKKFQKDNNKLYQYGVMAEEILKVSELLHEIGSVKIPALPQIKSPSTFGRMYYRSLNLQNAPKVVRHAALGHYNQYDITSSIFAWQLHCINDAFKTPATKELVIYKDMIRTMLVNDCMRNTPVEQETKLKFIKQAITALGFGARIDGGAYFDLESNRWIRSAINDTIKNKDDRLVFQNHKWVKEFCAEQIKITDYIIANTDVESLRHIPELWSAKTNKLRPSSLMAYLYQQYESTLMTTIKQLIPQEFEFLLGVHDAFYTRHKLPGTMIQEYAQAINPYIKFEREEKSGWTTFDKEEEQEYTNKIRRLISNMEQGKFADIDSSREREKAYRFFNALDNVLTIEHLQADIEVWKICEPYYEEWQELRLKKHLPYERRLYKGKMNMGKDFYDR